MSHLGSVADSEHRREGSFDKLLHKQWSKQCFLFARTRLFDAIEASLRFADRGNAESLNQDSRDEVWLNQKKSKDVSEWFCTCDCCLKMTSKISTFTFIIQVAWRCWFRLKTKWAARFGGLLERTLSLKFPASCTLWTGPFPRARPSSWCTKTASRIVN